MLLSDFLCNHYYTLIQVLLSFEGMIMEQKRPDKIIKSFLEKAETDVPTRGTLGNRSYP
jgi:hypothetical protein